MSINRNYDISNLDDSANFQIDMTGSYAADAKGGGGGGGGGKPGGGGSGLVTTYTSGDQTSAMLMSSISRSTSAATGLRSSKPS